ncbi:MAG TPA: substrate-binding domain-containing protein, partial [Thermoanaerobaculia bacterium]|nr:substrate-binding domain-containing protein [Thermoanaerobaculia bacterium]
GSAFECNGDFTEELGYEAANVIVKQKPRATAIFAANDAMAIGALSALTDLGVDVPGSMSVAGFDDIPIARYVAPPLTTIRVDIAELGRRAFALLHGAMTAQGKHNHGQECIGTTLIVRKSTASRRVRKKGEGP